VSLIAVPPGWPDWEAVMREALAEAERGRDLGEVPVGAVVLGADGTPLARACNAPITRNDPTAHAEILALRGAAETVANYRLDGAILAVTLEPCLMCVGALVHARVAGVVFGARDPKAGALSSRLRAVDLPFLNHRFPVYGGVLADECGQVLKDFFAARRK
jgi:tRNA(adenine34) deaminase